MNSLVRKSAVAVVPSYTAVSAALRSSGRRSASSGVEPLFARLRDSLRADILAGRLAAGARLPSEAGLIERHGVSRITVRQALRELQQQGLVETVNGKGTFVSRPGCQRSSAPFVGVLEAMRRRGETLSVRVISTRTVPASADVARELDVAPRAPVGALSIARYRDARVFAVGTTWGETSLIDRLGLEDLSQTDLMAVVEATLGVRVGRTRVVVSALAADAALAKRLAMTPGAPVLRIRTTSLDHDGRPIVCSTTNCRPEVMDYRVTVTSVAEGAANTSRATGRRTIR